jgi:hypothetical protein
MTATMAASGRAHLAKPDRQNSLLRSLASASVRDTISPELEDLAASIVPVNTASSAYGSAPKPLATGTGLMSKAIDVGS